MKLFLAACCLTIILCVGGSFALVGCKNQPTSAHAIAYLTLKDTKTLVDGAEKVYGRECALSHVSDADQKKVDEKIVQFHAAFKLAVKAARMDYTTQTPPDLQKLANSLVNVIYAFVPK